MSQQYDEDGVRAVLSAPQLAAVLTRGPISQTEMLTNRLWGGLQVAAGLTGQETATLTQQSTTKLAETLKARSELANQIGVSLDIVVPFGFAGSIKAARVARITMGRISLDAHETEAGSLIGGHTILKHVGRTEAQLRERLRLEPKRDVVSSFRDLQAAEWAISKVMDSNTPRIRSWAQSNPTRLLILHQDRRNVVPTILCIAWWLSQSGL
ncbi:RNase A-like domain-containing protein [Paraburkholderia sp. 40]|uniref:RNase A-like domain-containing protein n=1 Tax=Paraburkholderia sp. 40 TaxID=2991059 RepID=UPI003D24EAC8